MSNKTLVLVSIMVMALAASLFGAPSISRADTIVIKDISVTVGGTTWCGSSSGTCVGNNIWSTGLTSSGITLLGGQSLILTQTGLTASGVNNFDSSDRGGEAGSTPCDSTHLCTTTLSINGAAITPTGTSKDNLADNNGDIGGTVHNEAHDWGTSVGSFGPSNFDKVFFGYADNLHSGSCGDNPGGNCLPNSASLNLFNSTIPNGGNSPTFFIGTGTSGNGLVPVQNTDGFHCLVTTTTRGCFDGGAILIQITQPVPEPVTMFLGGTGLILFGYAARRRLVAR